MKVLIATKALSLNSTSAGIGVTKLVRALARNNYDVTCLTSDENFHDDGTLDIPDSTKRVRVIHTASPEHTGRWERICGAHKRLSRNRAGAYAARKIGAGVAYATGHQPEIWRRVERWRLALCGVIESERPDVVFTRGAGCGFEPHIAMLGLTQTVPWVANYHDPYPLSLYPEPYRHRTPIVSAWQEAIHRRIVTRADALTFPSRRLMEWVLTGDLARHRTKAFVVPHIAAEVPRAGSHETTDAASRKSFTLVHTGTLLGPRDPQGLLRGFLNFIEGDAERTAHAHLMHLGSVNRKHTAHPDWATLSASGNLHIHDQRSSYDHALDMVRGASALVVLEAGGAESPFFPGKLADYLCQEKPILALSPAASATADILGADYPLRVAPDDIDGITHALERLWAGWTTNGLARLVPHAGIRNSVSEVSVCARLSCAFDVAMNPSLSTINPRRTQQPRHA